MKSACRAVIRILPAHRLPNLTTPILTERRAVRLAADIPDIPPLARVLYVDDFHDVDDTAVMFLSLFGFTARAVYDGAMALTVAAEFHPHVCFLDLNMPGMGGDELAVKLQKQEGREMLLVAVTAMSGDAVYARLTGAGFHFHLLKPADPESMLAILRAQL